MVNPKSTLKKRGEVYCLHYFENGVRKRVSLGTDSLRIAQEKQRQFDSARVRGHDNPLPTQTPLPRIVQAYIRHMQARRTKHGVTSEISRLRKLFGPVCPELEHGQRCRKELLIPVDGRLREPVIAAVYIEQISTEQVAEFIRERVQRYGLEPKTANGYRTAMQRLFNWAMEEGGARWMNSVCTCRSAPRRMASTRVALLPEVTLRCESNSTAHCHLDWSVAVSFFASAARTCGERSSPRRLRWATSRLLPR